MRTTFNRLRAVKDSLPHGSMDAIAAELGLTGDEVRAFFNGEGTADYHLEPGFDGGIVDQHAHLGGCLASRMGSTKCALITKAYAEGSIQVDAPKGNCSDSFCWSNTFFVWRARVCE